ncbi:VanZ family protein [Defluviitalea phaphyphila]|uniref:VanZ family protein n=1 Tax=Defluviitalea phaphyphila TaxID=1473580 RepID=UPI000730356E|nr:VanZ family protein [Defluviitalea phaphyphila]
MPKLDFLYWIPAIIWMCVIFILSSMTGNDLQRTFPFFSDFNWGHFVAYFILAITYYIGLFKKVKKPRIFYIIILLCVLYGITDEVHQFFVPTRVPDIKDLFSDTIGSITASLFLVVIHKLKEKEGNNRSYYE